MNKFRFLFFVISLFMTLGAGIMPAPAAEPKIAPGGRYTITLKTDGTLWAWGSNTFGQLGINPADGNPHPTPVQIDTDTTWTSVTAGWNHTIALKTNGTLWAWGSNNFGQLGIGTADGNAHPTPVQIGTDTTWTSVTAGNFYTIARKADGTLWAWGSNNFGQLGIAPADGNPHPTPLQIGTDTTWSTMTAGWDHTIALKADRTLWAWGSNNFGQIGIGPADGNPHPTPLQIGTDTTWSIVTAGVYHTSALKTDGTLWAWGYNEFGQLGIGTADVGAHPTPVKIGTDTTWTSVKAGNSYTNALKADGTLWAWGYNVQGQLGDGSTTDRYAPVQIGAATNWTFVAAGDHHAIALKADGTLWAWGYNDRGQLGDGTTDDQHAPVQILYALTINRAGTGAGTVRGSGSYSLGTTQEITATAGTGSTFTAWSGDCAGTTSPLDVLINGNKTCTATFTLNQYTLTINKAGVGSGTVTGEGTYGYGTTQPITATAGTGSTFTGWSGDCSGTTSPLDVLINGNKTCTATFQEKFPWSLFLPAIIKGIQ